MKQRASDVSENELFERLRTGDSTALEFFYYLYSNNIYGFAFQLLDNEFDAQDITSTAFALLWKNHESLKSPQHVKNFLYSTVKHRSLNILRDWKLAAGHFKDLGSKGDISSYQADLKILRSEAVAAIYRDISRLPSKRMQDIFVMRFIEDREPEEIARALNVNVKIVYNDTEYARKKMQAWLLDRGLNLSYLLLILSLSGTDIK